MKIAKGEAGCWPRLGGGKVEGDGVAGKQAHGIGGKPAGLVSLYRDEQRQSFGLDRDIIACGGFGDGLRQVGWQQVIGFVGFWRKDIAPQTEEKTTMGCSQSTENTSGEMPAVDSRKQGTTKTTTKNADPAASPKGT